MKQYIGKNGNPFHLKVFALPSKLDFRRSKQYSSLSSPYCTTKGMPHYLLASKTAAITGGTTGIGRAIALEYIRQGCNVAINHLNLPSDAHHKASLIEDAASIREKDEKAGKLIEVAGDVTKPETGKNLVEVAVRTFGQLDIFISNAGVCQFAEFLE
jgi:L-rhamnose 1-dehydrogenase